MKTFSKIALVAFAAAMIGAAPGARTSGPVALPQTGIECPGGRVICDKHGCHCAGPIT